ncbi:MAG: tetratricopeptide repeat protein, partial [Rhodospirillales bacterium]|nr:tetratricopeptide repeat protein [Rhodospirillales bacterium]
MAGKAGTYRLSHRFRLGPGGGLAAARAAPPAPPADPVMTQASPADAVMTAAAAHYAAGRLDAAAEACEALLARRPDHFDARHLLGVARHATGRLDEARAHLLRASELAPENARARYHLGNACLALERFAEAEAAFRCALARDPDLLEARNNLGNALRRQGREMAALDCYRAVLARRPDFAPALYNMGLALAALGEFDAAIDCYRTVLARPPGPGEAARYADVQEALSTALVETGRHELAVEACRRWRGLAPDAWRAEWNEALSLLALGRYAGGWPLYERRWELPEARAARGGDGPPPVPTLAGLEGKRVLVRWEQGRGDVIQFARYLPLLARHAASVTVRVYPELQALLGRMPGVAAAIDDSAPEPAHDVAVALISLPLVFGTTVETVPAQVPYLAAAPGAAARWRARLAAAAA